MASPTVLLGRDFPTDLRGTVEGKPNLRVVAYSVGGGRRVEHSTGVYAAEDLEIIGTALRSLRGRYERAAAAGSLDAKLKLSKLALLESLPNRTITVAGVLGYNIRTLGPGVRGLEVRFTYGEGQHQDGTGLYVRRTPSNRNGSLTFFEPDGTVVGDQSDQISASILADFANEIAPEAKD